MARKAKPRTKSKRVSRKVARAVVARTTAQAHAPRPDPRQTEIPGLPPPRPRTNERKSGNVLSIYPNEQLRGALEAAQEAMSTLYWRPGLSEVACRALEIGLPRLVSRAEAAKLIAAQENAEG